METKVKIKCPNCFKEYWIPQTDKRLRITCQVCGWVFYNSEPLTHTKNYKRYAKLFAYAIIISIIVYFISDFRISDIGKRTNSLSSLKSSNWITIDYGRLIDKSILTHSGETVGNVINKIPNYTDDFKGLVQQYLEPYSVLCHDVLLSSTKPDTLPLVNITSFYPVGSEQPAWATLFREGHYQIYFNKNLIRVFLKGTDPSISFEKYQSIVRLPILDIINSKPNLIKKVEVYVFKNDYASTKIKFNTTPQVFSIEDLDLSAHKKSLDLTSIESFLNNNIILEAIEVDKDNLFFYGKKSSKQTLAGSKISLSDIAVIYRSIFHYGNNSPYISLDNNEDNRYAKVNFGGNLENTHVGSVVLEADKLFKTLSTGLDPNTHRLISKNITKEVPEFLTEDERSLIENKDDGKTQIRYWFYPDSIGTVTDGSIGAILKYQFLADIERMDRKKSPSNAVKKTINHLNNNFAQYEKALHTFQELSSVGRIMALVNWLKGMNVNEKIELDELLSVRLPAFTTPTKTKKMLAITSITYPNKTRMNKNNIRSYSKTYYISNLLEKYSSLTTDDTFLEIAKNYLSKIDIAKTAPSEYKKLNSNENYYNHLSNSNKLKIKTLEKEIEKLRYSLNNYNSSEVDAFNKKINNYNSLLAQQKSYINKYNSIINKLNEMGIIRNAYRSIGGGINLRPSEFKQVLVNRSSPKLREILNVKKIIVNNDGITKADNWIRSVPTVNKTRITPVSTVEWTSSKTQNQQIQYSSSSSSGDKVTLTISPKLDKWETSTIINGYTNIVKYEKNINLLIVSHPDFGNNLKGKIYNEKTIEFYR